MMPEHSTNTPVSTATEAFPRGVRMVELTDKADERGHLVFLEIQKDIPWEVRRVFWITGVPDGQTRGGHSHQTCHEAVFPLSGAFDITLHDGTRQVTVRMDTPRRGILIPAGVWCRLEHFEPGTVCLAVASQEYDAAGYIDDFGEFMESSRKARTKEEQI